MAYELVTMKIGPRVHVALTEVRTQLADRRRQNVTYNETLLELVRHWHATQQLVNDAREAGR